MTLKARKMFWEEFVMKKVLLVSAVALGGIAVGLLVKKHCPLCSKKGNSTDK